MCSNPKIIVSFKHIEYEYRKNIEGSYIYLLQYCEKNHRKRMISSQKRWKKLFLFCLGLTVASVFCMKWMENDLLVQGEKFTIMGLELFYPKEKMLAVLAGLDQPVRTILRYHLSFDFIFMAGIFPGIAALCMMASFKFHTGIIKKIVVILAALQAVAWGFDITENSYLLKWISEPVIGDEFVFFHFVVAAKWIIALTGTLVALSILAVKKSAAKD